MIVHSVSSVDVISSSLLSIAVHDILTYEFSSNEGVLLVEIIRGRCLLQYWLDHRQMTQAEFARRTGWSKRMVSFIATGRSPMNPEAMYLAAHILGIQMEQLYEWEIKKK